MTFQISRSSCMCPAYSKSYYKDQTCAEYVEINTMEDLRDIYNEVKQDLIINFKSKNGYPSIRIYDSYIE